MKPTVLLDEGRMVCPLLSCLILSITAGRAPEPTPRQRLLDAAAKMGGLEAIHRLGTIRVEGVGHTLVITIAPGGPGPQPLQYEQFTELLDLGGRRARRTSDTRFVLRPQSFHSVTIVDSNAAAIESPSGQGAASAGSYYAASDAMALHPFLLVDAALQATTLTSLPARGNSGPGVGFSTGDADFKLFFDPETGLPRAGELTRAYPGDLFGMMTGRRTTRYRWGFWSLERGGIRYPRFWTVDQDDVRIGQVSLTKVDLGGPALPDSFTITAAARATFRTRIVLSAGDLARQNQPAGRSLELAGAIVMLPGVERAYNTTLVPVDQGLVVIEAPHSTANSVLALAEATRRFPGRRVIEVVSTSFMTSHLAGLREYVARGIPIRALAENREAIEELAHRSFRSAPDSEAVVTRNPRFLPFEPGLTVGRGPNRMVTYPFEGGAGARMAALYFPERRLLYASDLLSPAAFSADFHGEHLSELVDFVERHHLAVDSVFGLHVPPTGWAVIRDAAAERRSARQ